MNASAPPLAALLATVLVAACAPAPAPAQPLPFDHALHLTVHLDGEALTCTDCHAGAERGTRAGLPALATCLRCHMRPQGEPPSDAERQVRIAAAEGGPFRWIQVTRNPGHVHFSHAAHVTRAEMACATCHGDVAAWREPPTRPEPALLSMNRCLACHREHGAPTDCASCHQ
jgi:menaquinone reductase, multiheme cytochrome c subunit